MNDQTRIKELISRYVDGEVTDQEKTYVERLLKDNKSCYAYYKKMKGLDDLLNERPKEDLSSDWERKVLSSLDGVNAKEDNTMKNRVFTKSLSAGVMVIFLLVGLVSVQTYTKRGLQGRLKMATDDIGPQFSPGDAGVVRMKVSSDNYGMQYEPYYQSSSYQVDGYSSPSQYSMHDQAFQAEEFRRQAEAGNTEEYARIFENEFKTAIDNPLSTFSIDVDTGSYSNVRRFLNYNQMPPADAVRIEEMINYFSYNYPQPTGNDPFSINIDAAVAPWNTNHQLVRIGLKGKVLQSSEIPPSNLVFLVDVSGSMGSANKLPLLKKSLKMMVKQLSADQRVAMVVYAGAAGKVLDSTPGTEKQKIMDAIDRLSAGGSTAGGAGIKLAYDIAKENLIKGGNNRVILATDGDFNVGVSSTSEMTRLIEEKRKDGIFLTVVGFGMGNYKDGRLEQIANKGNGTYHYIDSEKEAKKVFVEELGSTLFTIAKDVKIQIEFNPAQVKAYRLIGYENRMLNKEDFNDDTKDAGELGAGHTVTALYEIVPAGSNEQFGSVDPLKYQSNQTVSSSTTEMMTVKLRYKEPDGFTSKLLQRSIDQREVRNAPQGDFAFTAAVAEFGMLLRDSKFKGRASYDHVIREAINNKGTDKSGYRAEFVDLVKKAQSLDQRPKTTEETNNNEPSYWGEQQTSDGIQFK